MDGNLNGVGNIPLYIIHDETKSHPDTQSPKSRHDAEESEISDHDTPTEALQTTSIPPLDTPSDEETPVVPFILHSNPSHSAIPPSESETPLTISTLEKMRLFFEGDTTWEEIDDLDDPLSDYGMFHLSCKLSDRSTISETV